MASRSTDSGLPRRDAGRTMEVVPHQHEGLDDPNHRHRMGQIPHQHDEEGRPVVGANAKFTPAGPVVSPLDDTDPTLVTGNATVPDPPKTEKAPPMGAPGSYIATGKETSAALNQYQDVPTSGTAGRPDASEGVLAVAMGTINPADADPIIAMRHAEESARVLIIGQHVGNMFQSIAPPNKQFVANRDLRVVYRKIREIADFHGIDLDEVG